MCRKNSTYIQMILEYTVKVLYNINRGLIVHYGLVEGEGYGE